MRTRLSAKHLLLCGLASSRDNIGRLRRTYQCRPILRRADGVYRGEWKGTVNGKVVDSAIGIVGWDAARKGIRIEWVSRNGAYASNLIKKRKNRWVGNFVLVSPDGTKSTHRDIVTIEAGKLTNKQTNRKRGGESLADQTITSTKK